MNRDCMSSQQLVNFIHEHINKVSAIPDGRLNWTFGKVIVLSNDRLLVLLKNAGEQPICCV